MCHIINQVIGFRGNQAAHDFVVFQLLSQAINRVVVELLVVILVLTVLQLPELQMQVLHTFVHENQVQQELSQFRMFRERIECPLLQEILDVLTTTMLGIIKTSADLLDVVRIKL